MNRSRNPLWFIAGAVVLLTVCACVTVFAGAIAFMMPASGQITSFDFEFGPPAVQTVPQRPTTPTPRRIEQAEPVRLPTPTPGGETAVQDRARIDELDPFEQTLAELYQRVNPSVVNISVSSQRRGTGSGSGFIWDEDGHIVTNSHVVRGADEIIVTFYDDRQVRATLVGDDPDSDLAVIKVDPTERALRPVERGDSTQVVVGQRAIAIGNPFQLSGTMTQGIISAVGRSIPSITQFSIPEAIQTDAPINPGNSGGPLLDLRGRVIGINAQIRSDTRANSGVGFAIPIHIAERVVPALIERGRYDHPYIGIRGNTLTSIMNESLGLPEEQRGAYVSEVLSGGPAARAGLRAGTEGTGIVVGIDATGRPIELKAGGDVIIGIEGQPVNTFDDLLIYLSRYASPGDRVMLSVLREGDVIEVPLTLGTRPRQ